MISVREHIAMGRSKTIKEVRDKALQPHIQKIIDKQNCTTEEAKSIWFRGKGIAAEQALVKMIGKWGFKIRRVPRSGANPKAVKYKRKEKPKTCDCILKLDSRNIQVESKWRTNPHGVYDKIITSQKNNKKDSKIPIISYVLNYEGEIYYAMHQDIFKKILVDSAIPQFTAWPDEDIKFYHDFFVATPEKAKFIDIVSLKQGGYDFIFLVRPKTMEFLKQRCQFF